MSNILRAFINIVNNHKIEVQNVTQGNNRANNMGEGLESYIKDAFADTTYETNEQNKLEKLEKIYSYQGNKNNPPDLMLQNSDAIEIKKIESKNSAIALNSSYPKAKLYANSPMITKACRECEDWDIKDMLYAIGYVKQSNLKSLWLIYGDCFCADKEIYERIKDTISNGINGIADVEFTETKELGKVKKVDPLGITDLRIRGMWHIENPNKTFSYIYEYDESLEFQLMALMSSEKYNSFPLEDREVIEGFDGVEVRDVRIKSPNNPVKLMEAKLLIFKIKGINMDYPKYKLTLHKTYYEKGFFNLGVSVNSYLKLDNGEITIYLGEEKQRIIGKINRDANQNSTPRIFGGNELKKWIQKNCKLQEIIFVYILSSDTIWIKKI